MPSSTSPNFAIDYARHQVGAVVTPLGAGSTNPLLQDADPALYFALDYWTSLIRLYEGDRILAVAALGNIKRPDGLLIQDAVQQAYPWTPDLERETDQFQFPLLACYRKDSKYRRVTAGWEDDRCTFDLLYIMPPLTGMQAELLLPVFRAVEGTLRKGTTRGFDPNYQPPGGNLGDPIWRAPLSSADPLGPSGIEEIGFEQGHYATWQATGNLRFPMLHMEGYLLERDNPVPGVNPFTGADTTISLYGNDGTLVSPFVQMSTQQAPTVTGVSPAVGPLAGGTAITVTGTNLLAGPIVFLGTQRIYGASVPSSTSLTFTTPAGTNAGTVSLTIINRDGQSAAVASAFTYQ